MINGAVFFDYDGTLVDEREAIYVASEKTKKAIKTLQDKGYLCMLATGRALSYVPQAAKELEMDGCICSNGAYVNVHGRCIYQEVFDKEEVMVLIQEMNNEDINYFLESYDKCYVKDIDEERFLSFVDTFQLPMTSFEVMKDITLLLDKVEKITILPKTVETTNRWMQKVKKDYDICRHRHVTSFEIGKKHIHKGVGVEKVIAHFQIPYEHTYAFGDGTNDIGMLKSVCHGIAMEKHAKELDEFAQFITTSVKEEGIYHALKKMEVIA